MGCILLMPDDVEKLGTALSKAPSLKVVSLTWGMLLWGPVEIFLTNPNLEKIRCTYSDEPCLGIKELSEKLDSERLKKLVVWEPDD